MGNTQPNVQGDGKNMKVGEKKRMTRHVNNQAPTLGLAHNLKHTRCESKGKSERTLVIEWSCNLSKIFS